MAAIVPENRLRIADDRDSPRPTRILLVALLLAGNSLAAAGFEAWRWQAELTAPEKPFVALVLTPELLNACDKPDLSDLRLTDARGVEIPYAIVREREKREERELVGRELNRDQPDGSTSRLTVDFGTSEVKNRITVETTGENFRRRVRVEGSADQETWADLITEGWVFAVGKERGGRFESLDLGENTYRYIRVSVRKMAEESEPPTIKSLSCRHVVVEKPPETVVSAILESYSQEPESRTSVALADFSHRHLPIVRLKLTLASDPLRVFQRECFVWGRNSLERVERIRFETDELGEERVVETPWSEVGGSRVFRDASGRESLELNLGAPYRYLRIQIRNGNSPPLDVGGVDAVLYPVYLLFEPAGGTRFTLYAGNREATVPRYEARSALESLEAGKLPKAGLGDLVAQAAAQPVPASGSQTAVWILMGIAVIATAALLWYTAARRKPGKARARTDPS